MVANRNGNHSPTEVETNSPTTNQKPAAASHRPNEDEAQPSESADLSEH